MASQQPEESSETQEENSSAVPALREHDDVEPMDIYGGSEISTSLSTNEMNSSLLTETGSIHILPPPPSVLLLPPSVTEATSLRSLSTMKGKLETALELCRKSKRWLLVIIDAAGIMNTFSAPESVISSVSVWKPWKKSADIETYTNFFPVTTDLHVALLDPRSGERLNVWGEPQSEDDDNSSAVRWIEISSYLEKFISSHSIEGFDLGPLHHRQKPWFVSTRRESPTVAQSSSSYHAVDEQAALEVAIKASLDQENEEKRSTSGDVESRSSENDENGFSFASEPKINNHAVHDLSAGHFRYVSMSNIQPSTPRATNASVSPQIEKAEMSHIKRYQSNFQSSKNPRLSEIRKLKEEQDNELAASIQEDIRKKQEAEEREKLQIELENSRKVARSRLPVEPEENDRNAVAIALRLPDGRRLTRRFLQSAQLSSVADLCLFESGINIAKLSLHQAFQIKAIELQNYSWQSEIGHVCDGRAISVIVLH